MDFVTDSLVTGRRFRALMIVDDYSRECPAIEVDTSIGGRRMVQVLERLAESRGLPEVITLNKGPEFAGKALDEWAYSRGVKLNFVRPGRPIENACAESFIGRLRDEFLNESWFLSLRNASEIIQSWRVNYNDVRPHSALHGLIPREDSNSGRPAVWEKAKSDSETPEYRPSDLHLHQRDGQRAISGRKQLRPLPCPETPDSSTRHPP